MWETPMTTWEEWGNLLMAFAKNEVPRPTVVTDLNKQMTDRGIDGQFDKDRFHDVAYAQAPNETTLQIFLPTAGAIDRGMQMVQVPGFRWTLPDFYCRDAFDGHPVNVKEANNVKFLAERIGDYAIGQCG